MKKKKVEHVLPRDWYAIAEGPAPAPHLAHPQGCAALLIVLGRRSFQAQTRALGIGCNYLRTLVYLVIYDSV